MNTLRVGSVARKLDVSVSTVWRFVKVVPRFPKPFKLGPSTTVWSEQELDEYLLINKQGECDEN